MLVPASRMFRWGLLFVLVLLWLNSKQSVLGSLSHVQELQGPSVRALGAAKKKQPAKKKPIPSILFIGNSLTSKNKLPLQFTRLAKAAKKKINVYSALIPSASLDFHAVSAYTMNRLRARKYTFVVMQEQSAYLSYGLSFAQRYSWPGALALQSAAGNSTIILYETMAYKNGFDVGDSYDLMQARITDGYERLRQRMECETAHVGRVWQRARWAYRAKNQSEISPLYYDDKHPNQKGTYLAACTIFAQVFKQRTRLLRPALDRKVPRAFANQAQRWVDQERGVLREF